MTFTISPSQVETFTLCERKWAFDKIDKIPRAPNKYAQAGTDLHTVAEQWLRDGVAPPDNEIGDAFRGGMRHLPLPRTVEVEVEARFERHGVHYLERLDAFSTERASMRCLTAHVLDHKSTGDLKWADEKQAALVEHRDPQWLMYGAWAAQEHDVDLVLGTWVYYLRRKPYSSRKLTTSATSAQLLELFDERIHPISLRILQARNEPSSARPKNLQACDRFGGCPYREHCLANVSPLKRIAAMTSINDPSSARGRLATRAKQANPQGESPLVRKLRENREKREAIEREAKKPEMEVISETLGPERVEHFLPEGPVKKEEKPAQVQEQEMRDDPPKPSTWTPSEDTSAPAPEPSEHVEPVTDPQPVVSGAVLMGGEPKTRKRRTGRPRGSKNKKSDAATEAKADKVIDAVIAEKKAEQSVVEREYKERSAKLLGDVERWEATKADVLVRLHVAAIGAHAGPEVANAHYRSILEQIEGER